MTLYKRFECYDRNIHDTTQHVYVYSIKNNCLIFERTVDCEASAIDHITDLKQKYNINGVYSVNFPIRGTYY